MKLDVYKNLGMINNNLYVIIENKKAILIDIPEGTIEIIKKYEDKGIKIVRALITHGHPDHITEAKKIQEKGIEISAHKKEEALLIKPWAISFLKADPLNIDTEIKDKEEITLGEVTIKSFHTPGHTLGGLCFYIKNEGILFTGDVLFKNSIGRTDFPGGNYQEIIKSIKEKILILPESTKVYPGHGDKTTIRSEKKTNPFISHL